MTPHFSRRELRDWAAVAVTAVVIFVAAPSAPVVDGRVDAALGRDVFLYACAASVVFAFVFVALRVRRSSASSPVSYVWLAAVAAGYLGYAWSLREIPEESVHLVEYGWLGFLAFRALSHRVHDATIYASAVALSAIVGILDEALQWVTPGRTWGLTDIGTNVVGASLVQLAIAGGIRPAFVQALPTAAGVRVFCRLAIVALLLLGATLLNTPERIEWYSSRVPALGFLRTSASVMLEYGYLYRDPDAGIFRSRLSPEALRRTDAQRGPEAARILDAYPDHRYRDFLSTYTPVSDPFVHEARVHLFSRDKHIRLARDERTPAGERGWHATVAWRENLILERYFGRALASSAARLSPSDAAFLDAVRVGWDRVPAAERESWVSRTLVTDLTESEIMAVFSVVLVLLLIVERIAARAAEA